MKLPRTEVREQLKMSKKIIESKVIWQLVHGT